jgi:ABC-type Mn2+/Zn2+ transport system ATPase subunit
MPTFDIIKEIKPKQTFRVASVIGKFDLQSEHIIERFKGNIDIDNEWQIGLIVGHSGTGKTTIAKQLFSDILINSFDYKNETILDDMPKECSLEQITNAFNSVGFSSPPSWLKPYNVLSNGEKMRVNLANAILSDNEMFAYDEFTSVVDREVAKIGSFAMQKAIRKTNKKFIAITCHHDVEDWLLPDWVFNTNDMTFYDNRKQKKNRPEIKFRIYETKEKSKYWSMFAKYHYLSHTHNNAARVFIATVNDEIAGFISVIAQPSGMKGQKRVHRLVILPDYQGVGIGVRLLNEIGKIYKNDNWRYTINTTSPSLINALKISDKWNCHHYGRIRGYKNKMGKTISNKITASFELK